MRILLYNQKGMELEVNFDSGRMIETSRESYLHYQDRMWKKKKGKLLGEREDFPKLRLYLDIEWFTHRPLFPEGDFTSLEKAIKDQKIAWDDAILRVDDSSSLSEATRFTFYNITFEPGHPEFRDGREVVEENLTGYPYVSSEMSYRSDSDGIYEESSFRMLLASTRCVMVDVEKYNESQEKAFSGKLEKEFLQYLGIKDDGEKSS